MQPNCVWVAQLQSSLQLETWVGIGKSLVRMEREMTAPDMKASHHQHCQGILHNLKSAKKKDDKASLLPRCEPFGLCFLAACKEPIASDMQILMP